MKYNEILKTNKNFQYSINLQYDIENIGKFTGYIPTRESIKILSKYMENIYSDNSTKATVLIGPYGKGKSHLLLVLLGLLGDNEFSIKEKNSIIKKFKLIDEDTFKVADYLVNKAKKKFMPIIINNNLDLKQSFLIGLSEAMERSSLSDITINTYYDSVIEIVDMWKSKYPIAIEILQNELYKCGTDIDKFIEEIKKYSSQAYQMFENIYPMISSGIKYNPLVNTDIVKLYEEINHKICNEYDYDGIFIVFDEFSKFIESSIERNISSDLKMLQDFAELASRSRKEQIHLTCVTHKSINEYISKIPESRIDAWRAIEGRFTEFHFTSSAKQNFELIGNTIVKDKEKTIEIIKNNEKISNRYEDESRIFEGLLNKKEFDESIKIECFPISPLAVYALPSISEKVAQNERTLFTFLSKEGKNTFKYFIDNNQAPALLNIDMIYDYFENLFKKEIFNKSISDTWLKVDSSVKRCERELGKKILKGLGLIYILNDYEVVPPNITTLSLAFGINRRELEKEINSLISNNILILRKSNEYLDFMPMTNLNIKQKINDLVNSKYKNVNIAVEFNKFILPGYVLPKKYNDDYKMTRFFKNIFMNLEQLKAYYSDQTGFDLIVDRNFSDGVIINLIYENEVDRIEAEKLIRLSNDERVVAKIPNKIFTKRNEILELLAINNLLEDEELLSEDLLVKAQLDLIKEDLEESLNLYYTNMFLLPNTDINIMYKGNFEFITKDSKFNRFLSEICESVYSNTVVINNEMINKDFINPPILKGRNTVIDIILENDKRENYKSTSVEETIYKATLLKKNLITSTGDEDIKKVLEIIKEFVLSAEENKISFEVLYKKLRGKDNKISMRKGVIPIYIALILKGFKDDIIIYLNEKNSREVELEYSILNNINENPEKYYISLEKGTNEKKEYIEALEELFNIDKKSTNKYKEIFIKMQQWIQGLSKLTRIHKNIELEIDSECVIKFRNNLIKYDVNVREFLFKDLMVIFKVKNYQELLKNIINVKNYLDSYLDLYEENLIQLTKNKLLKSYKGSLGMAFELWLNNLEEYKKNHLYKNIVNEFINYASDIKGKSDKVIIENLSFIVTGLSVGDWNEEIFESYEFNLNEILNCINEYIQAEETSSTSNLNCKINLGLEEKTFEIEEISSLGKTIVNNIEEVFEDYGNSVSDNEKRSILIQMLKQYM